jgi:hypothetical protein
MCNPRGGVQLNKFQNVSTLTIVIKENFGGDHTSISYIGFKGEVTNVRPYQSPNLWPALHFQQGSGA